MKIGVGWPLLCNLHFGIDFLPVFLRFLLIFAAAVDALPVSFWSHSVQALVANFVRLPTCDISPNTVKYNTKTTFSRLRRFCRFLQNSIFFVSGTLRSIEKIVFFRAAPRSFTGLVLTSIFDSVWLHFRVKIFEKRVPEGYLKKSRF